MIYTFAPLGEAILGSATGSFLDSSADKIPEVIRITVAVTKVFIMLIDLYFLIIRVN